MTLRINLLGPLVIEVNGETLGPPPGYPRYRQKPARTVPKKARALLAYLACQNDQPVSRERIADLLWPYQQSRQARHSLRNCVLELRRALGPAAVDNFIPDFANCRTQDISLDCTIFERLSNSRHRGNLELATTMYRGEFLADFYIASEPLSEWLDIARDRYEKLIIEALLRLSELMSSDRDHSSAIAAARRAVHLDPLYEPSHQALITAYNAAGLRGEARRAYLECANTLRRELGVVPELATTIVLQGALPLGYRAHLEGLAAAMTEQSEDGAFRRSTAAQAAKALLTMAKLLPRGREPSGINERVAA